MSVERSPPPSRRSSSVRPGENRSEYPLASERRTSLGRSADTCVAGESTRDVVLPAPPAIDAINACKLQPFCKEDPDLWFLQAESFFRLNNIRSEDTRYHVVMTSLTGDVLREVADILRAPPADRKYESLKAAILQRLTDSTDRQLHKMLTQLELGDRKPSQLLRHMRSLAGDRASEDILRIKFLDLLPVHTQRLLKIFKSMSLEETAAAADELMDTGPAVMAAGRAEADHLSLSPASSGRASPSLDSALILAELRSIRLAFAQLSGAIHEVLEDRVDARNNSSHRRPRPRSRSRPLHRSPSPAAPSGPCTYHRWFGDDARRCMFPCSRTTLVPPTDNAENR